MLEDKTTGWICRTLKFWICLEGKIHARIWLPNAPLSTTRTPYTSFQWSALRPNFEPCHLWENKVLHHLSYYKLIGNSHYHSHETSLHFVLKYVFTLTFPAMPQLWLGAHDFMYLTRWKFMITSMVEKIKKFHLKGSLCSHKRIRNRLINWWVTCSRKPRKWGEQKRP